jgi:hypothetical protein
MARSIEVTDDLIVEHLAHHPSGDDSFSDAATHPYEFLKGYRDAEAGKPETMEDHWSIAVANAYRLGRFEWENG